MPDLHKHTSGQTGHLIGIYMKRTAVGLLFIAGVLALLVASVDPAAEALAQGGQKVGLVVRFGNGSVFTDCIDYTGPGMTGEDVLDGSGLLIVKDSSYGLGAAICKIRNDGCDYPNPDSCFCECTGDPPCLYWAYYHLDQQEGQWVYSGMGASWHSVQPGDVEGWAWGNGEVGGSDVEPPLATFEELCAPPTATPTRTPRPSPPVVEFTADPQDIVAGGCSTLRWMVDNGEVVALDGEGVRPDDARYVCPPETHTFELLVLNAAGEFDYEVTISVRQPTATPYPAATHASPPTPTSRATSPPPPPTETPTTEQSEARTSPPSTPRPTVVAMLSTATPAVAQEQTAVEPEPQNAAIAQPTMPATASEEAPDETVGLDRILLLLGVGAGTLGFGTVAFAATVILLLAIYFRARAQF